MPVKKYTIEEIKAIVEPIARKYGVARVYLLKECLLYVVCIQKLKKLYR